MDLQDHEEALRFMLDFPAQGEMVFSALGVVRAALMDFELEGNSSPSEQVNDFASEALARIIVDFAPEGTLITLRALMDSEEFEEEAEEEFEDEG